MTKKSDTTETFVMKNMEIMKTMVTTTELCFVRKPLYASFSLLAKSVAALLRYDMTSHSTLTFLLCADLKGVLLFF